MADHLIDTADQLDPVQAVAWLLRESARAEALAGHYADRARKDGRTWRQIAEALGVTPQAASQRFSTPP